MDFVIKVLLMLIPWQISARVLSPPSVARLSLAEPNPSFYYSNIDGEPGTYSFGYDVSDQSSGNTQFRNEERFPNGTVVGTYGYLDPNGRPHMYRYIADNKGYRVMRERPFSRPPSYSYSWPVIINSSASSNEQENEITWTRKKPNGEIKIFHTKPELENIKFIKTMQEGPMYSWPVITSSSSSPDELEKSDWMRPNPNGAIKNFYSKPKLGNKKSVKYPFRYFSY